VQDAVQVVFLDQVGLVQLENAEDELIKEDPLVAVEAVEEDAHFFKGDHRRKQSKNPFTCIHLSFYIMVL